VIAARVEGVPALLARPERPAGPLALWLSHLGGSKEQTRPVLEALAARGHPAVSFNAHLHGERAEHEPQELLRLVMADFRRRMWPILAQTTLDALRVVDWALAETGGDTVLAGGVSMGGDIAVALAGIDDRVTRVAALASTPDWARPGMTALDDPGRPLDQGDGDRYARWLRSQLDPMLHLDRYRRGVAIAFECGAADTHVPPANAEAFAAALGDRVRVRRRPGLDHLAVARDPAALDACLDFLGA
jgi:dienelactone hydrolase